jgi:hypothetical protein
MKVLSILTALLLTIPSSSPQASAQTSTSSNQATTLLRQSLAALTGSTALSDVTLTGTARRIAGSDDESGTVTVKALAGTGTRIDLSLPSGTRSELRNTSSVPPAGSWSGPDAVWHSISNHNLLTDSGWFPAFALSSLPSALNAVTTYLGQETKNGHSVYHLSAYQQFPQMFPKTATLTQHLTQTEIFLDASTLLPLALDFNTHPDSDASLDIPVELLFSDYRSINGAQIPFHIQKFLNGSLMLDLQFQTAALNTGLAASTFSAQ